MWVGFFVFGLGVYFVVRSSAYPRPRKEKKKCKLLKDVIFAKRILTDLHFLPQWPGASLSGGGHFNMPRCEVDVKTAISASLN